MIEKKIAFIFTIVSVSQVLGFIDVSSIFYTLSLVAILAFFLLRGKIKIANIYCVFFILASFLSLLVNEVPEYFMAWYRLAYFIILLLVVSPIIYSRRFSVFRIYFIKYTIIILTFFCLCSFFCYFIGVNFMTVKGEYVDISSGTFAGLFSHSMFLGPLASLATIFMLVCFLYLRKNIFIILGFICFGALLFSASRGALISCILSILNVIYIYSNKKVVNFIKYIFIFSLFIFVTYPIWGGYATMIIEKQSNNKEFGGTFYSRENKWESRMQEFDSSPIFGIGFATVNPELDTVDKEKGIIEPGSSWLGVLSMTGILGIVPFLFIFIKCYSDLLKLKENSIISLFLLGGLVFFMSHFLVEGYVLAAGNYLCLLCWSMLGGIDAICRKS